MIKDSRSATESVGNNRRQQSPAKDAIQKRREQNRRSQQNYRRRVHNRLQLLDRVLQGNDTNDTFVEELLAKSDTAKKPTNDIDTNQPDVFTTDQAQSLPWSTQVLSPRSLNGGLWPCEDQEFKDASESLVPALSTPWNPTFHETAPSTIPNPLLSPAQSKRVTAEDKLAPSLADENSLCTDDSGLNPILYDAASHGRVSIVRILLDQGADPYVQNAHGQTALHAAAQTGNEAISRLLLDHGIDVDIRDRDGATALRIAAIAGFDNVAKLLIGAGAQLDH
ncbi:hypothetical protein B9Z65_4426 [Elsinoe australis]|uniref:Uncharacterized protein n=1 Tax=Elsinoe australis TaxID=40998 RepID=A0A2P7Z2R6_9PEZI|nr:hypothetical protein B9Z65_4426 [Elsinoe australis]